MIKHTYLKHKTYKRGRSVSNKRPVSNKVFIKMNKVWQRSALCSVLSS